MDYECFIKMIILFNRIIQLDKGFIKAFPFVKEKHLKRGVTWL